MSRVMRRATIFASGLLLAYGLYCFAGYSAIRHLPANVLVDLVLYPQDISNEWKLVPCVDYLSLKAIKGRTLAEIRADFSGLDYTLYSGALGYRDANSDPRTRRSPSEEERARALTLILHDSGLRVGVEVLDAVGCTSVHQAILAGDASSASFLLEMENLHDVPGNPNAKYVPCRQDISAFAKMHGLVLN